MKKIKPLIGAALLSTCLVGNVFAGEVAGGGVFGFFTNVVNTVVSVVTGNDNCQSSRHCQNCKPTEEGGDDNNCKPSEN